MSSTAWRRVEGRRPNSTYFQIWQYLEMSGQMRIFADLLVPPVVMELEAGLAAESVLMLIGDKSTRMFLFPGIDRHDYTEIYHLALKGSQN
jgi:hypothetical protein